MLPQPTEILDISQPIDERTACFPGDVPFQREITVDFQSSQVMNLTAFRMSPHVGTHADAPVHIQGDLQEATSASPQNAAIGYQSLTPYLGPVMVVDLASQSHYTQGISWDAVAKILSQYPTFPERILFKTRQQLQYDRFESDYAFLTVSLIEQLAARGVKLVGLDTPSVDPVDSKTLDAHHSLCKVHMAWLENLDFSRWQAKPSDPAELFFLSALPLRFHTLEASPVRAVLLRF